MNKRFTAVSLTLGALALATGAQADSWNVTQKVHAVEETTLTQGQGNTSAVQAMNAVSKADLNSVQQTVYLGGASLDLVQTDAALTGTQGSVQAANYINAGTLSVAGIAADEAGRHFNQELTGAAATLNLSQTTQGDGNAQAINYATASTIAALTQGVTLSSGGTITLSQDALGENSLQAVNAGIAVAAINDLEQEVGDVSTVTLDQTASNSGNHQAVNHAASEKIVDLAQGVGTITLDLEQGGANNTQAANHAVSTGSIEGTLVQSATALHTDLDQAGGSNLQAVNAVEAAVVTSETGSIRQSVYNGTGVFRQGLAVSASASTQAGNYLDVAENGAIASVTQVYDAASSATLEQDSVTYSVQGLNVVDASASGVTITSASQSADVPALTLTQGATSGTSAAIQAANAVITSAAASGGTVDQEVFTTSLAMTQTNGSHSIQAANFVGAMSDI